MNGFVKWWIVHYLKKNKIGGVENILKTITHFQNKGNISEMALREYNLKKQDFTDNKLARNFLALY